MKLNQVFVHTLLQCQCSPGRLVGNLALSMRAILTLPLVADQPSSEETSFSETSPSDEVSPDGVPYSEISPEVSRAAPWTLTLNITSADGMTSPFYQFGATFMVTSSC
jgi:hypothetical protein